MRIKDINKLEIGHIYLWNHQNVINGPATPYLVEVVDIGVDSVRCHFISLQTKDRIFDNVSYKEKLIDEGKVKIYEIEERMWQLLTRKEIK